MNSELNKKVEQAKRLFKLFSNGQRIEVAYSGGKDSDCLLALAKMSGVDFVSRYKNTTIDPPGTLKHAMDNGVEVLKPAETFLDIVKRKGMPSRYARFCCQILKEYNTEITKVATGVRKAESRARSERYQEPTSCFNGTERLMPMLDWTDNDVAEFIRQEKIQCHPLYYDENGNFRVERRLGCIACPLKSTKKRIEDYRRYPVLLKHSIDAMQYYMDVHPGSKVSANFGGSAYEKFIYDLFHGEKGRNRMSIKEFNSRMFLDEDKENFIKYFGL